MTNGTHRDDDFAGGAAPSFGATANPAWRTGLDLDGDDPGLMATAELLAGALAAVHFDPPSPKSGRVTALVHADDLARVERGRYVEIICRGDRRRYVGRVIEGPFYVPDVLRPDSTSVRWMVLNQGKAEGRLLQLPEYHGAIAVELLGERRDGDLRGATHRPHPGSPVFPQAADAMTAMFNLAGDLRLGHLDGYPDVLVGLDSRDKAIVPRNLLTVGTIGSGKSNTTQVLIEESLKAGFAHIVLDPEGEYINMDRPAERPDLAELLAPYERRPAGVGKLRVYRPPQADSRRDGAIPFSVPFDSLAPEVIVELTEMTGPQALRFNDLYEQAIVLLKKTGAASAGGADTLGQRDDVDITRGFPGMRLDRLIELVADELADHEWKRAHEATLARAEKAKADWEEKREKAVAKRKTAGSATNEVDADIDTESPDFFKGIPARPATYFRTHGLPPLLTQHVDAQPFRLLGKKLRELQRLRLFDQPDAPPLNMKELSEPGRLSVIDLSDTDDQQLINLIVADLLARMFRYKMELTENANALRKVLITIEEAHGFVPKERLDQIEQTMFQLTRIVRRGRKRWLALNFVTQSPQHLPSEIFELANNKIIHQTTGTENLRVLRTAVGSVNEAIWDDVPTLGRGRVVIASAQFPHPLLVQIRLAAARREFTS